MNQPTKAIIRPPAKSFIACISDHPQKKTVNYTKALEQHSKYEEVLRELGLEIIKLPIENSFPDSCFVEDTAVIHGSKALLTRMGAVSRRGEDSAVEQYLADYFQLQRVGSPGTLEGGDVIHFSNELIVGQTQRTNRDGIRQLREWLEVPVISIEDKTIMHIKSYITYLGRETFIVTEKYASHPKLAAFNKIIVPKGEEYAANTLTIGESVLMAANRPKTIELVQSEGFEVIPLQTTEFEKCCGALTCLSILF